MRHGIEVVGNTVCSALNSVTTNQPAYLVVSAIVIVAAMAHRITDPTPESEEREGKSEKQREREREREQVRKLCEGSQDGSVSRS